jgi:hypothetical protein
MERTVTRVSHPPAAAPAAILVVVDGLLIFRLDCPSSEEVIPSMLLNIFDVECKSHPVCEICDACETWSSGICTHRSILKGPDHGLPIPTMHHQRFVVQGLDTVFHAVCTDATRTMTEQRPCCRWRRLDEPRSAAGRKRRRWSPDDCGSDETVSVGWSGHGSSY